MRKFITYTLIMAKKTEINDIPIRTPDQIKNLPVNIIELDESELKKYVAVRDGQNFLAGDVVHIHNNEYAVIGKKNILTKEKITKFNTVLRKK